MDISVILKVLPIVLTLIEMIKRFIPDNHRTWANPVLAMITGLIGAFIAGGTPEVLNVLVNGLLAGAGAVGAYKIPKVIGQNMNIN